MTFARVIAVSNQKGGVGKTTSAVNLAACLAAAEYKVLLLDLDPQGNASSALGKDSRNATETIYEILTEDLPIQKAVVKTDLAYLDLIMANQDLTGAEIELVSVLGREQRLKDALAGMRTAYDFIIMDCPPALGLLTVNALVAADGVLIPLQCEYFALEGLSQLQKTIALVKKVLNRGLRLDGILLTMFDRRNNLCHQVEEEVRHHFGHTVLRTKIPRTVKLGEAPSHGKPIILYDASSPGSTSYLEASKELVTRSQKVRETTGSTGTSLSQRLPTTYEHHSAVPQS